MSPAVLRSGALLMLALHTHIHAYVMFTEPIVKLPPGNYCKTSDGNLLCCEKSRDDKCSIKVNNTRCYCDYFCLRSNGKDCCPDFRDVCLDNVPRTSNPLKPTDSNRSHKYCNQTEKKSLCCEGRDDSCRIQDVDGECFCDNFCEHKADCCPDYHDTCRNSTPKPSCSPRHSNFENEKNCIPTSVPDWSIVNGTILGSCTKIGGSNHCCKDRDDNCRVPVTDYTYCYCDNFCTNPKTKDCCYDYKKVCEGETTDAKEGGHDVIASSEPSTDRPRYSSPHLPPYGSKTISYGSCKKYGCCRNRNDNCSDTFGITFCYCDQFCMEKVSNDCCPDFDASLCKYDKTTTASENTTPSTTTEPTTTTTSTVMTTTEITIDTTVSSTTTYTPTSTKPPISCYYEGQYYQRGECVYTNCNICSCKESLTRDNELEMICEQTPCIVDVTLKESVNLNLDLIWHASNYSFYWARSLQDGVQYRLGTLEPGRMICGIKSSETDLDKMYPSCFDARIQWPDWVSGVQDQGWCSSSWALSTVQTASDRMAIWSKGAKLFEFSAQQLLDCNLDEQSRACRGGHLDRAWLYIDDSGLLEERCYSYTSGNTSDVDECLMSDKMSDDCQPITLPKTEDHHSGRIYLLPTEQAIMHEIMTYGPVQATMSVHRDFFMYQSGVYQPSPEVLDRVEGYHSVRLLGWGVDIDNDRHAVKYWLAANTWGTHWGEKGYFRIRRGHNDCEIESYVIATKPFHNASSNDLEEDDSDEYDNY